MKRQKKYLFNIINMRSKFKGLYMKISAINYQTRPVFTGDKSTKDKLKNAAGAAAIALASMVPAAEANAQYPIYPYSTYIQVSNRVKVPSSFKYGDARNVQTSKSREERFSEIDKNSNGILSENEVVTTEINNWNAFNPIMATTSMVYQWRNQFRHLSQKYNEDPSNPNTITYSEYEAIMDDYDSQFEEPTIAAPLIPLYPYFYPPPPPRHHHPHHHRH